MSTLELVLDDKVKDWVEDEARAAGLGSAGEYLSRSLQQAYARRERLEELLLAGLESGPPQRVDEAWWDKLYTDLGVSQAER